MQSDLSWGTAGLNLVEERKMQYLIETGILLLFARKLQGGQQRTLWLKDQEAEETEKEENICRRKKGPEKQERE